MRVIVNFKAYHESVARNAVSLARKIYLPGVVVCPAAPDLAAVSSPKFAQHVDPIAPGAHTGHVSPAHLKSLGVHGSLINHSERRLPLKVIKETVKACKKHKLTSVVCASSLLVVKSVAKFKPDYIAYEPPSLIGGKTSVTNVSPGIIKKAVDHLKSSRVKLLVGAGVHSNDDVRAALEFGAKGVLVASAVVKSSDPRRLVKSMLKV